VPLVFPPISIDRRQYWDGGLLNPLPVYAAVDLGATEILALHALPVIPSRLLQPFALAFRAVFGVNPPLPPGVTLRVLEPSQRRLGSMRDALQWRRDHSERWLDLGAQDARSAMGKPFPTRIVLGDNGEDRYA
jgi:predicted acylesterase/phospholipase RssA